MPSQILGIGAVGGEWEFFQRLAILGFEEKPEVAGFVEVLLFDEDVELVGERPESAIEEPGEDARFQDPRPKTGGRCGSAKFQGPSAKEQPGEDARFQDARHKTGGTAGLRAVHGLTMGTGPAGWLRESGSRLHAVQGEPAAHDLLFRPFRSFRC